MNQEILSKAKNWTKAPFDSATQAEVTELIENNFTQLEEQFYKDLEFGTGGMRGKMGVGTNRINKYTIGQATQGLAQYLINQFGSENSSVAVAFDSRNNSPLFAQVAASVLSANGIKVHIFPELRPTPQLSFALRELGCKAGIVITASHNPPEYNGYKVYWQDGAQVVPPHDKGIIEEVRGVNIEQVNFNTNTDLIFEISENMDKLYLDQVKTLGLKDHHEIKSKFKIVFTGLHGTGITLVPKVLKENGYEQVLLVEEQSDPDGDFPTVESPNPEEKSALQMAINLAEEKNADLVLGTDPDADRVGAVARDKQGNLQLLNGNQACALIVYFRLESLKAKSKIPRNGFVAKTVVTSDLISKMADHYGVKVYETLTGFKYIAEVINKLEGKEVFLGGGEESYGYLVGDFVRDKDAVISSLMLADCAAWAASQNKTLLDLLEEIYSKFGHYQEKLISVKKEGIQGQAEIKKIMDNFRENPPEKIGGIKVVTITDILKGEKLFVESKETKTLNLPSSNVIQFELENGIKFSARPSGTEPKIKFYFSATEKADQDLKTQKKKLISLIENTVTALDLD